MDALLIGHHRSSGHQSGASPWLWRDSSHGLSSMFHELDSASLRFQWASIGFFTVFDRVKNWVFSLVFVAWSELD